MASEIDSLRRSSRRKGTDLAAGALLNSPPTCCLLPQEKGADRQQRVQDRKRLAQLNGSPTVQRKAAE